MPRKVELTWLPGSNGRRGRWRKKYRRMTYYFAFGSAKSDVEGYKQAIKLPVESHLLKRVLYALAARFDDEKAIIDKTVSSAKPLMRLPGPWNCKGKDPAQRAHRLAHLVSAPKKLKLVSQTLLEKVAAIPGAAHGHPSTVPAPATTGLDNSSDLSQASAYLDQMEPAVRTHSDGSSKAIKAARAIVVGLDLPWDSEAAWTPLTHYNARCKPPSCATRRGRALLAMQRDRLPARLIKHGRPRCSALGRRSRGSRPPTRPRASLRPCFWSSLDDLLVGL